MIEKLLKCNEFVTGDWIKNSRNYDGKLAKIVGPLLGWKREHAPSHDFVTPEGKKIEVKKFMNGNGWFSGSNMIKTPDDVTYMIVCYNKNKHVKQVYMIPFTIVKNFVLTEKRVRLDLVEEIVKESKDFYGQITIRKSDLNKMIA